MSVELALITAGLVLLAIALARAIDHYLRELRSEQEEEVEDA